MRPGSPQGGRDRYPEGITWQRAGGILCFALLLDERETDPGKTEDELDTFVPPRVETDEG